MIQEHCQCQIR